MKISQCQNNNNNNNNNHYYYYHYCRYYKTLNFHIFLHNCLLLMFSHLYFYFNNDNLLFTSHGTSCHLFYTMSILNLFCKTLNNFLGRLQLIIFVMRGGLHTSLWLYTIGQKAHELLMPISPVISKKVYKFFHVVSPLPMYPTPDVS